MSKPWLFCRDSGPPPNDSEGLALRIRRVAWHKRCILSPVMFGGVVIALLLILSGIIGGPAYAKDPIEPKDLKKLADGKPSAAGTKLPDSSYVEVPTRAFAQPKLLYFNVEYARELGIEIPPEGITPAFEAKIMEAFAYGVPDPKDPPEAFKDGKKTFYASKYGGQGAGQSKGDGRSASAGAFSVKGLGKTPLATDSSFDHNHGGASIKESIQEAVWGEMMHQRTGKANRVLCIIGTGTYTHWPDGGKEARALIVRGDFVRPAHFLPSRNTDEATEAARKKAVKEYLFANLPQSQDMKAMSEVARLQLALKFFARDLGTVYGKMHGAGFYHGATSPSNMMLPSGIADYGTSTSQPGFGPIAVLLHDSPFLKEGEEIERDIFKPLIEAAELVAPVDVNKGQLMRKFREAHDAAFHREILLLTGIPEKYVDSYLANNRTEGAATDLAKTLIEIGRYVPLSRIMVDEKMPMETSLISLRKMLVEIAEAAKFGHGKIGEVVRKYRDSQVTDVPMERWTRLVDLYWKMYQDAKTQAGKEDISIEAFEKLVARNAVSVNRIHPQLYRAEFAQAQIAMVDEYQRTGDPKVLRTGIQKMIDTNSKLVVPHGQVLESRFSNLGGEVFVDKRFAAKENASLGEVRLPIRKGAVVFLGKTYDAHQFVKEARAVFYDHAGRTVAFIPGAFAIEGEAVTLTIPSSHLSETAIVEIKFPPGSGQAVRVPVHIADPHVLECAEKWLQLVG